MSHQLKVTIAPGPGEAPLTLRFGLYNHSVAEKFFQIVSKIYQNEGKHSYVSFVENHSKHKAQLALAELQTIRQEILAKKSQTESLPLTQETLNLWHREFHNYIENHKGEAKDWDELYERFNLAIHKVEQTSSGESSYLTFFMENDFPKIRPQLNDQELLLKTLVSKPGELYMFYEGPGKNLFHCFLDNDLTVVNSHEIVEQWNVTPGVVIPFGDRSLDETKAESLKKEFEIWCSKNTSYDPNDPRYRPGHIPLGKLIDPSQMADLHRLRAESELLEVSIT